MKIFCIPALMAVALLSTSVAVAATNDTGLDQTRVLPVFVGVNAQGKVVRVEPAITLHAKQKKALDEAINTMITKPAMKDGHGIYSQFVLVLEVGQDASANGGTTFRYLSAQPAPAGPMHWIREKGAGPDKFRLAATQDPTFSAIQNSPVPQVVPQRQASN